MALSHRRSCADYHVAWICPVADLELLPARLMLDEEHPVPPYDGHADDNTYICGSIRGHSIVIATCPPGETGNVNAGRLAAPMTKTFPNIKITLLVGIGGGIPKRVIPEDPYDDIHLGDVVVGWPGDGKPACVYHDLGRSKVNGDFELVGTMQNPGWKLTNALGILESDHGLGLTTFQDHLARLEGREQFAYPGYEHDKLFKSGYRHTGAYYSHCSTCDHNELVQRPRRREKDKQRFIFHRGRIATGNSVIQDGELRDRIRAICDEALCVEMEAAGVDVNMKCLVIRGISDYADSHKNDLWRSYAAGNAAAFARELLCKMQPNVVKEGEREAVTEAPWLVPFVTPPSFVGRRSQIEKIEAHVSSEGCQRLAICGLGGSGKTALALELAYRTRDQDVTRAIFWIPAISRDSFEQAYRDIARNLRIADAVDGKTDFKKLVQTKLSDENFGPWLIIIDNADDVGILLDRVEEENGVARLIDYLPHSRKGSILFTTRTRKAAIALAQSNVVQLGELSEAEATQMLNNSLLRKELLQDHRIVLEFLETLTFFALAIVQAVAFVNANDISLTTYIQTFRRSETAAIGLLSHEFEDQGRYRDTANPVATTWFISFEHIQKCDKLAADYLSFMACTTGESIPISLLMSSSTPLEQMDVEAFGTLKAYAFISERRLQGDNGKQSHERSEVFDVHALVHLATRNWLKEHDRWASWLKIVSERLADVVPLCDIKKRLIWTPYLPHAIHVAHLLGPQDIKIRINLLDRIGSCEHDLGNYEAAGLILRQALELKTATLGEEHLSSINGMRRLASALTFRFKYEEAEALCQKAITLSENMSKKTQRQYRMTSYCKEQLAITYSRQKKYEETTMMVRDRLDTSNQAPGTQITSRPFTVHIRAKALIGQRKYLEAEQLLDTLKRDRKLLDSQFQSLTLKVNLEALYLKQKRWAEAEQLGAEMLPTFQQIYGERHPATLQSMARLAYAWMKQGRNDEALVMLEECVALRLQVLGADHRDTIRINVRLARWKRRFQKGRVCRRVCSNALDYSSMGLERGS